MTLAHFGSFAVVVVNRTDCNHEVADFDSVFVCELAVVGVIGTEKFECIARTFGVVGDNPCAGAVGNVD